MEIVNIAVPTYTLDLHYVKQAGSSCNNSDLYSRSVKFKSQMGPHPEVFCGFSHPSRQMSIEFLTLCQNSLH
jgi:hypothetical protein